jgi:prevent-host-death family protein
MPNIPISEAKARLAALVREVAATGEAYVISVNGRPMVELRPFIPVPTPGRFRNEIRFEKDAFAPVSDREAEAWGV